MPEPLYTPDGDLLVPGQITQGPWSPDSQHGGPVAALLARTIESVDPPGPMQLVRMTVDILKPVPIRPLLAAAVVSRPGRKVQVVDAHISVDGQDVAWARGLCLRSEPVEVPAPEPALAGPAPPENLDRARLRARTPFAEAVDIRFISGAWDELGPATIWTRLTVPVVAGEEASPMQRSAAGADFANGVSRVVDFDTHVFVNPDLTVALSRVPEGEWIGFEMASRLSPSGYGQAECLIFDTEGPVGRAVQSLYVERR